MAHTPPGRTREKVYRFVAERLMAGSPPTVREVQEAMGFRAVESARKHLQALVADGRLTAAPGRARGYRLAAVDGAPRVPAVVPRVGRVPAGDLSQAVELAEGYVIVDSRFSADELFALTVQGDSMNGAGILSGDTVIVRRGARAEAGDVVVALIGDETTVKTLRFERGRPRLVPANPAFEPIIPAPDELRILGVVVELRRTLS